MKNNELKTKIKNLKIALNKGLVGREDEINLVLLALLAEENIVFIGEPGTAKSEMARRIEKCLPTNSNYFEYLLTKFTTPEEIFGGISIPKLKEGKQERMIEGYLPSAHVGFLDEIFKANSSILNSFLTILNEKIYHDGSRKIKTPLKIIIGASNELPTEDELNALYDRFIFRKEVLPVKDEDIISLLEAETEDFCIKEELKFTFEELAEIKENSKNVIIQRDVLEILRDLRSEINKYYNEKGMKVKISDRRIKKMVKILKVSAYTNGRKEVNISDLYILENILWNSLEERKDIRNILISLLKSKHLMIEKDEQEKIYENIFKTFNIDKEKIKTSLDFSNFVKSNTQEFQEINDNIWLNIKS